MPDMEETIKREENVRRKEAPGRQETVRWEMTPWGCGLGVNEQGTELLVCFPDMPCGAWQDAERELWQELRDRGVCFGVQEDAIRAFFDAPEEKRVFTAARGTAPGDGRDDVIEYLFVTDGTTRPARRPDGSVDFHELNVIQVRRRGDLLARLRKGEKGYNGRDIYGREIGHRQGRRLTLRPGNGCNVTEDGLCLTAAEDGHVALREGVVCVSPVCRIDRVDLSTGNISFGGSVEIGGDVASDLRIRAGGDVIVYGSVEAARIEAEGSIVIRGGMNGMGRGTLRAGGNILVKFLERVSAEAGGCVHAGAILYSRVISGSFVEADGKKGAITGGRVTADTGIRARLLGSVMGMPTVLTVGGAFRVKKEYREILERQQKLAREEEGLKKALKQLALRLCSGQKPGQGQLALMKKLVKRQEEYSNQKAKNRKRMEEIQKKPEQESGAFVEVRDTAYPGVVIVIGEASARIMTECCGRFVREGQDVGLTSL